MGLHACSGGIKYLLPAFPSVVSQLHHALSPYCYLSYGFGVAMFCQWAITMATKINSSLLNKSLLSERFLQFLLRHIDICWQLFSSLRGGR